MRRFILIFLCAGLWSITVNGQNLLSATATMVSENDAHSVVNVKWEQKSSDFQKVEVGEEVSQTFTFTNNSEEAIQIQKVKPSCGCTATEYTKEWIQPGESGFVTAQFKAKNKGYFTKTVTVTYGPTAQQQVLTLRGEAISSSE